MGDVKLNSSGGGSVTLTTPSTASNLTVTLPSASGTLATTSGTGSVFTNPTINGFTGDTSVVNIGSGQFYKDTSGNVGIGTSSPVANHQLTIKAPTSNYAQIALVGGDTSSQWDVSAYNDGSQFFIGYANSPKLRLDSSGNLGLGVTPFTAISGWTTLNVGNSSIGTKNATGSVNFGANATLGNKYITSNSASLYAQDLGTHYWYTAPSGTAGNAITFTQAMTLESGGNLLLGTTTNSYSGLLVLSAACSLKNPITLQDTGVSYGTNIYYEWFLNSTGGTAGSIAHTGATSVAYQTGSDRRLKKNIENSPAGLSKVNQMLVRAFDWKEDDSHIDYGFIAQELYEIFPEAVAKGDDAIEIEDPKETWQVEYGRLTPILAKAIQELSAKNSELESRLAALEGK